MHRQNKHWKSYNLIPQFPFLKASSEMQTLKFHSIINWIPILTEYQLLGYMLYWKYCTNKTQQKVYITKAYVGIRLFKGKYK